MTQDDLIKMAKAAGFETRLFNSIDGDEIVVGDYFLTDRLRDFANLVAEATKEKIQAEHYKFLEESKKEQDWSKVDGAIAWHLIDRHADSWAEVGAMMDAWKEATTIREQK